jgi:hypothetical protein
LPRDLFDRQLRPPLIPLAPSPPALSGGDFR